MVHTFKFDDKYYIFDNVSSSLHICDKLTSEVIKKLNGEEYDFGDATEEDISETEAEIELLKEQGLLFKDEERIVPKKSEYLKALCLHICHDCNLRCEYCFASEGSFKGEREMMSFEVAKKAIDFLIANSGERKVLEVDFFGGEPLMNLGVIKQTVDYAREKAAEKGKKFLFTTTTNGVLMNEKTSEWLNREMENVVMSLDGRKCVHDAVRKTVNGKGSYDLIIDNFKRFAANRGDKSYYVRGTFTHLNTDFADDVLYIADQGFKEISLEPVVLEKGNKLAITEEDLSKIKSEYERLAREYINREKEGKGFNFFHFQIDLEGGPCLNKRINACGAGNEYLSVTPKGELFPCHQFADNPDFLMGNVFDGVIDEKIRGMFKNSNLFTREGCENCFAKYHCSGGCPANNYNFNGDINKPYAMTCEMMKKRTECAMHILADRKEREENNKRD